VSRYYGPFSFGQSVRLTPSGATGHNILIGEDLMKLNLTAATCVVVFAGLASGIIAQPNPDWPQWRGPNRDGAIASFTPPAAWPEQLTRKWKIDVGLGYATPLLVGNRIYMFSRQSDNETMSAIDADSGRAIWQTRYPVTFEMNSGAKPHGAGPKSTPTFSNGKLYAIGMTGVVTALDAASGARLWQKPASSPVPLYTTHAFSPVVDRGLVFFHLGGHNQGALTAFDANTGDVKWSWNGDGPGYGSPMVAELGGTRQIVTITQGKVVGVDIATGQLLWERPVFTTFSNNSLTPILYGQTVMVSTYQQPTSAFSVKKQNNQWVTETVWENPDLSMWMTNGVVVRDALFGLSTRNRGQYVSVDVKTGKTLWRSEERQADNAAIIRAGDWVFSLQNDGELVVFRSSAAAFEPVRRYKVADSETWAPPTISGNRVFVKDVSTLALWTLN
jgi:outer membrane protein assembly factor BamB